MAPLFGCWYGNLIGKHFDIFRCMSSAEITVLLYEAEAVMFHAREKRSRVTERLFNERQCTADDGNDEIEENVSVSRMWMKWNCG